ncbi:hypothetical protein F5148DRAFT_449316 [Russula earlei]|uniref:Uncharacterized protein n=1 Tax=Russula earlei TaxID=71964 RepID=A0ACC0TZM7_9AGAM|nr:hypothetical protein F5148DRAFT_449316 [Russula earlei]
MGTLCSKQSHLTGGHTLALPSTNPSGSPPRLGPQTADDRRSQAAAAAEERMNAATKRGVNNANPNSGRLAALVEASKTARQEPPEPRGRQDTLIDDWRN